MKSSVFGVTSSLLFALTMSFGMGKAQSFQISSGVNRAGFIERTGIDDFVPPSQDTDYESYEIGARPNMGLEGEQVTFIKTGEDTSGQYTLAEVESPPQAGPPLHVHSQETEWFYITEGEYSFQIDNQSFAATPGDLIRSVPGEEHEFNKVGTMPGTLNLVWKPAGLEEFFKETSAEVLSSSPIPNDLQISAASSEAELELLPNNTTAVPEPSGSLGALAAGAFGIVSILKRKRK
jgi:quercetin dioxygenase-like cupin family protein